MVVAVIPEHTDLPGAGDHDVAFTWGHPRDSLTLRNQVRLTILRGHVKDREGAIVGDADWVQVTPGGVLVVRVWRDEPEAS